jgi:hypothetical protein
MRQVLKACRSSTTFMTVAELAKLSDTSAKKVARFIVILEAQGCRFRKRVRSSGVTEYQLINEPRESAPVPYQRS